MIFLKLSSTFLRWFYKNHHRKKVLKESLKNPFLKAVFKDDFRKPSLKTLPIALNFISLLLALPISHGATTFSPLPFVCSFSVSQRSSLTLPFLSRDRAPKLSKPQGSRELQAQEEERNLFVTCATVMKVSTKALRVIAVSTMTKAWR